MLTCICVGMKFVLLGWKVFSWKNMYMTLHVLLPSPLIVYSFVLFKDMVDFPRYKYGFVDCEVLAYSSNVKSLHTVLNFRIQFRLYFSYCGFIISNYQLLVYISIYHTHNYYPSATNQEYQQRILCIPHIYKFNFF